MTSGAGSRWCGLAGMAGGLLLLIFYAALAARQAIDWQAGPTLGTPIHLPLMGTISLAMLLLIVAVAGVLASRIDRLGWGAGAGGLLALSGFVLWAYAAAENFVAFAEPPWWHALLFPTLVALGSLVFGLGGVRSRALPWGGVLVGVFGVLGMALLTAPDLAEGLLHRPLSTAEYPVVRMAGFLVMLPYGGGWVWLRYSLWRPRRN